MTRARRPRLSIALALLVAQACEKAEVVELPRPAQRGEIVEVRVADPLVATQPTLRSGGAEEPPSYFAYLPPGGDEPLPVLYLLTDLGQDLSAYPLFLGLGALLDRLIDSGEIDPILVVMPNGLNEMGGGFYTDSVLVPGGDPVDDNAFGPWGGQLFRVMEDAEARFATRTEPFDTEVVLAGGGSAGGRAIGGVGMGAYGAFVGAVRAPVFEALVLHSGFLDLRGGIMNADPIVGASWAGALLAETRALLGEDRLIPESATLRDHPDAPFSEMIFAMAAAFSPALGPLDSFDMAAQIDSNLSHADPDGDPLNNFQVPIRRLAGAQRRAAPADDLWLGVWLPVQADGGIVDGVLLRWSLYHDPLIMAGDAAAMAPLADAGSAVWIDAGGSDEYGLSDDSERFAEALGRNLDSVTLDRHGGGHSEHLLERLEISLLWVSDVIAQ